MLFGHLHTGSVRLLQRGQAGSQVTPRAHSRSTGPKAGMVEGSPSDSQWPPVMYLSPSFTPRNPTPHRGGVRMYELSRASSKSAALVQDIVEHQLDLDASNQAHSAVWTAESLRAAFNLSRLDHSAWTAWARSLRNDTKFAQLYSPQRCADEIEADYAKCKASALCALTELEPRPYAECLASVHAHAVPPPGWSPANKRQP